MDELEPSLHVNLDDAWPEGVLGLPTLDLRAWGPRLRYIAPRRLVAGFWRELEPRLRRFTLYGSGDFHYLSGLFVRRAAARGGVRVVSFDNHPDWDVRPPYWSCGGWAARAARARGVGSVSVWGCGNFELRRPARLFADRRALRSGRLEVVAWSERQPPEVQERFDCVSRDGWRERFLLLAAGLAGARVYVTVDLDCLRLEDAATNWENGLFAAEDVAWAIDALRGSADVIAGDVCGACSPPVYARSLQRLAGAWDHPRLEPATREEALARNVASLERIWPALTGSTGVRSSG